MIIVSSSHFELAIFDFNPGHLLNCCADIRKLNSMQWMGQPMLSIHRAFYKKKIPNLNENRQKKKCNACTFLPVSNLCFL